ncbi:hypothetical protein M9H77_32534 [Catharanthus roseus]|uniref:Uncharacterized protein n=1 Tax=Catharanthus roseus TaxID=4058 RepID=A0ACC0A382_CATRO|nr:hypothetical protein M9H77_32534 [Catharanthus roseus]
MATRIPLPFIVAVAVIFFSLALSDARIASKIPGDEEINNSGDILQNSIPESDDVSNRIIRLPTDAAADEPIRETKESEPLTLQPLHVVRIRPLDRRFSFRIPNLRCRHHHHHHHYNRMFNNMPMRQIPYGDDMILPSRREGERGDFDSSAMFHGGVRRIQPRWVKLHHHDEDDENHEEMPKWMLKHSDSFGKEKFKKHKHHHHHEDEEEDDDDHKEMKKEKSGGFMKSIRKFLHHF